MSEDGDKGPSPEEQEQEQLAKQQEAQLQEQLAAQKAKQKAADKRAQDLKVRTLRLGATGGGGGLFGSGNQTLG